MENFIKNIIAQIATDLTDEFDQNFDREGFFTEKWKNRKSSTGNHKILNKRGNSGLRGSINMKISANNIIWTSSKPYAAIHNEGGTIKATQNVGAFSRVVKGKPQNVKSFSRQINTKMPQRQFIGDHPIVRKSIETIIDKEMKKLEQEIFNKLKR